jgi:hypothetical protein
MKVTVLPEAYINNTMETNISNTSQAILNSGILDKYQEEILKHPEGCLFKLINNDTEHSIYIEEYVSANEFTAPSNIVYVSNMIYDNMLLSQDDGGQTIEIEIFTPPQATDILFKLSHPDILDGNIKENLESIITKKYKFLKIGDRIDIGSYYVTVVKLEPYDICMVNNTDINVEFDIPETIPETTPANNPTVSNTNKPLYRPMSPTLQEETESDIVSPPLNIEELRQKRLAFFTKQ